MGCVAPSSGVLGKLPGGVLAACGDPKEPDPTGGTATFGQHSERPSLSLPPRLREGEMTKLLPLGR